LKTFSHFVSVRFCFVEAPRVPPHISTFSVTSAVRAGVRVCGRCDYLFRPSPLHCVSLTARVSTLHFGTVPMLFCKKVPHHLFIQRLVRVYPPVEMETSAFHKIQPRLFYRSTHCRTTVSSKAPTHENCVKFDMLKQAIYSTSPAHNKNKAYNKHDSKSAGNF
jgi:hypothetical protein